MTNLILNGLNVTKIYCDCIASDQSNINTANFWVNALLALMNFTVTTIVLELMIFHYNLYRKNISTYDWILEKRGRSELQEEKKSKAKDLKEKTKQNLKQARRDLEEPTVSRLRVIFTFCKYFKSQEHLELRLTTGGGEPKNQTDHSNVSPHFSVGGTGVLVSTYQNNPNSPLQKNKTPLKNDPNDISNMMSDKSQIDMSVENSLNEYYIEKDFNNSDSNGSKGELGGNRGSTDGLIYDRNLGANSFDVEGDLGGLGVGVGVRGGG